MKKTSINNFMEDCRITIFNAADDPIISRRMLPFGFTPEKHQTNKNLYTAASELISKNELEQAEYKDASIAFKNTQEHARKNYKLATQRLKYWYSPTSAEALKLGLYEEKDIRYTDFVAASRKFYTQLLATPEALEKLSAFGNSQEELTADLAEVNSLDELKANREKESGDAQFAIKERDSKMEELAVVVADTRKLAKLIFTNDEAQYLEKLGITVKS